MTKEQVVARLRKCDQEDKLNEQNALKELREKGLLKEGFGELTRKQWASAVKEILVRWEVIPAPKKASRFSKNYKKNWSDMFPEGRRIFYEGDNPKGFCAEIKRRFGFDPSENDSWGKLIAPLSEYDEPFTSYSFHCPVEHLDAIYGTGEFPLGS